MRPIQLPGEKEGGDCLLYSGPNLGGWLNGTTDGVPKAMTLKPDLPGQLSTTEN